MLLSVDQAGKSANRVRGVRLREFDLDERALQQILFSSLDRLIGDDELLMLRQSRPWQEEPDLLALDRTGQLFIFEIKVWEARSENLLQVLRYGQKFGGYRYEDLDRIWRETVHLDESLSKAHEARFAVSLRSQDFNHRQVFVILTNGLDFRTREAIRYWRSSGLDMRPWIYRVYRILGEQMFIEISPFRTSDDPYEDVAEGYYVVNTNIRNNSQDDHDMLAGRKVAAYFDPWKFKIERLSRGDVVFLYRSGTGIVATGRADGDLRKAAYHGLSENADEEYSMGLLDFFEVTPPIGAAEIKGITASSYVFMQTMFGLDPDGGAKLLAVARERRG